MIKYFAVENFRSIKEENIIEFDSGIPVEIYISDPCIENWLLAHFQKINQNEPIQAIAVSMY